MADTAEIADTYKGLAVRRPDWELPDLPEGLHLDDHAPLKTSGRMKCDKCGKSRKFFCYMCKRALTAVPRVQLPVHISIITHPQEAMGNNTGVHAAILAPDQVTMHDIDDCPEFDKAKAVVLYPSDDALDVSALPAGSVERAFIIDSKWSHAKHVLKHEALSGVRKVKLSQTKSAFWRFHTTGVAEEGVCTVEALRFFLRSLVEHGVAGAEGGAGRLHVFDNLLWYFAYQHQVVAAAAAARAEKAKQMAAEGKPLPKLQLQMVRGKKKRLREEAAAHGKGAGAEEAGAAASKRKPDTTEQEAEQSQQS